MAGSVACLLVLLVLIGGINAVPAHLSPLSSASRFHVEGASSASVNHVRTAVFVSGSNPLTPALHATINVTASLVNEQLRQAMGAAAPVLLFDFFDLDGQSNSALFVYSTMTNSSHAAAYYQLMIGPVTTSIDCVTVSMAGISKVLQVPLLTASNSNSMFLDKSQFPTVLQVVSTDDKISLTILDIIHLMKWTRVAVITMTNTRGINEIFQLSSTPSLTSKSALIDFSADNNPSPSLLQRQQQQVVTAINDMLAADFRIYWIYCDVNNANLYFAVNEFAQRGLFQKDYLIIAALQAATDAYFHFWNARAGSMVARNYTAADLNGHLSAGMSLGDGEIWLSSAMQQHVLPLTDPAFYPNIQYMGDAVVVIAQALQRMMRMSVNATNTNLTWAWSASSFMAAATNLEFAGLNGASKLDRSCSLIPSLYIYSVENAVAVPKGTLFPNGSASITPSAFLFPSYYFLSPSQQQQQLQLQQLTGLVNIPPDRTIVNLPTQLIPSSFVVGVQVVVALLGGVTLCMHGLLLRFTRHPVIKSSSHVFCHITVAGSWPAFAGLLLYSYKDNNEVPMSCVLVPSLFALGVDLVYGAICLKTLRVYRIFLSRKIHIVHLLTDFQLLKVVMTAVMYDAVVMCVWVTTNMSTPKLYSDNSTQQWWACSSSNDQAFLVLLVVPKLIVLLVCSYLAYAVRNVESAFNESRYLAISLYSTMIMLVMVVPALLLLPTYLVSIHLLLYLLAVVFATTVAISILLVPKFFTIATRPKAALTKTTATLHSTAAFAAAASQMSPLSAAEPNNKSGNRSSEIASELGIDFSLVKTDGTAIKVVQALVRALKLYPTQFETFRRFLAGFCVHERRASDGGNVERISEATSSITGSATGGGGDGIMNRGVALMSSEARRSHSGHSNADNSFIISHRRSSAQLFLSDRYSSGGVDAAAASEQQLHHCRSSTVQITSSTTEPLCHTDALAQPIALAKAGKTGAETTMGGENPFTAATQPTHALPQVVMPQPISVTSVPQQRRKVAIHLYKE